MERLIEDVRTYIIDQLKDDRDWLERQDKAAGNHVDAAYWHDMEEGSELSNHLLNNNYFIIGTYKAKQWLGTYALNAIEKISNYERDNFGEVYTDLTDPEKIANMLSYILGNELLNECKALQMRWDTRLNKYTLQLIINELELRRGTS